jgi:hypothetical protein
MIIDLGNDRLRLEIALMRGIDLHAQARSRDGLWSTICANPSVKRAHIFPATPRAARWGQNIAYHRSRVMSSLSETPVSNPTRFTSGQRASLPTFSVRPCRTVSLRIRPFCAGVRVCCVHLFHA